MDTHLTLPPGTVLDSGNYIIRSVLGTGGFAKTYLAADEKLNRLVALKEYFPAELADRDGLTVRSHSSAGHASFEAGLKRFEAEAKVLARIRDPNIVGVFRSFLEHGTCYIVLEYVEGDDLEDWLIKIARQPTQDEIDRIAVPLLSALERVHKAEIVHRDVTPKNIRLRSRDGSPVLIDFGAHRVITPGGRTSTMALRTIGYAPIEAQSVDAKRLGPWTDIYGLAATLYRAISGERPIDSMERVLVDSLVPAQSLATKGYRKSFLAALDAGLRIHPDDRPKSIPDWRQAMLDRTEPKTTPVTGKTGKQTKAKPTDKPQTGRTGRPVTGPAAPATKATLQLPPKATPPAKQKSSFPLLMTAGFLLFATGSAAVVALQQGWIDPSLLKGPAGPKQQPVATTPQGAAPKVASIDPSKPGNITKPPVDSTPAKPVDVKPVISRPPASSSAWQVLTPSRDQSALTTIQLADGAGSGPLVLATGSDTGAIRLWRRSEGGDFTDAGLSLSFPGSVVAMAMSPGSPERLAVAAVRSDRAGSATLVFREARSDASNRTIDEPAGTRRLVKALAYVRPLDQFVSVSVLSDGETSRRRNVVERWTAGGQRSGGAIELSSLDFSAESAAVSPDGKWIAVATRPNAISLFELGSTTVARTLPTTTLVLALAFSPDGRWLSAGGRDGQVDVWDTTSSYAQKTLNIPRSDRSPVNVDVLSLAYSPDSRFLAAASSGDRLTVWDIAGQRVVNSVENRAATATDRYKTVSFLQQAPDALSVLYPWQDGSVKEIGVPLAR